MSLQMTRLAGKNNQNIPLKMLCATNFTWATIMQIVTIVHVSWPTCMARGGRGRREAKSREQETTRSTFEVGRRFGTVREAHKNSGNTNDRGSSTGRVKTLPDAMQTNKRKGNGGRWEGGEKHTSAAF